MEKMNQVSVSEFFAKSKEEMYDMAVEMVEKYNRLIDRHAVYTDALNNDIADKAAKIDLLEKEIEGRKEGYYALKELMDTKYISIEEHNNICEDFKKKIVKLEKESEKWQDLAKMNRDTICNQYDVCEDFKKKIAELEEENEKLKVDLIHEREKNEKLAKDYAVQENDIRKYTTEIKTLEEKVKHQRGNLDGINKTLEIRTKENESLIAVRNNLNKEIEAHESENARLSEKIKELKKERDKHMARVNDLRMELDCVKASKEKYEEAAHDKVVADLRESFNYWRTKCLAAQEEIEKLEGTIEEWKNKERIRTNELRATESKVEELWEEIERLRDLGEHWKRSYFNIRYSLNKLKDESKEDDYGKSGFKRYIEHLIEEEERAVPERFKERLNEEITAIFTKKEETEVKGVGRTSSGRYPWGAKVNDIPCGEDAIE